MLHKLIQNITDFYCTQQNYFSQILNTCQADRLCRQRRSGNGNGNFIYIGHFIKSELNVPFIKSQI